MRFITRPSGVCLLPIVPCESIHRNKLINSSLTQLTLSVLEAFHIYIYYYLRQIVLEIGSLATTNFK